MTTEEAIELAFRTAYSWGYHHGKNDNWTIDVDELWQQYKKEYFSTDKLNWSFSDFIKSKLL